MSDDEQLKVAWAALLMEDWRCLTRAASKLPMEKILALHPESILTNMNVLHPESGLDWAEENIGSMSLLGGVLYHQGFEDGAGRAFKIIYALLQPLPAPDKITLWRSADQEADDDGCVDVQWLLEFQGAGAADGPPVFPRRYDNDWCPHSIRSAAEERALMRFLHEAHGVELGSMKISGHQWSATIREKGSVT